MANKKILIVEDDGIIAARLEDTLTDWGYIVRSVISGEEAIEHALDMQPDLILMDVHLEGEMNGVEAAKMIRSRADIPMIYLTAYSDDTLVQQAKQTEPYGYLIKPVRDNELRVTLETVFYKYSTEQALKESEARYHAVVSQALESIFLFDIETRQILDTNPAFQKLMGYTEAELLSMTIYDFVSHDQNDIDIRLQKILKEKQYKITERQYIRKDGTQIPVEMSATLITYRGRSAVCVIAHDISERKRMETERREMEAHLRYVQKMESLGVMAGAVAHNFNNLLMVILGYAEIIASDVKESSNETSFMASEIVKAALRAKKIVEQILMYNRKTSLNPEPIHLSKLVQEMAPLLEAPLPKYVSVEYHLSDNLPMIHADAGHLRQMIVNLITNSKDAMGENSGSVFVKTGTIEADSDFLSEPYLDTDLPAGLYVLLEVTDNGEGMNAETISKMFDPFFTTRFPGRGLGLPAVLGIVRKHRGAIKVFSQPGEGTKIQVLLPPVVQM